MKFNSEAEKSLMDNYRIIRWSNGVFCPRCNSTNYKEGQTRNHVRRYYCKACKKGFNDFTGTPFSNKKIPLWKIFYIASNAKTKKIVEIAKEIGVSRNSVSNIINRFKDHVLEDMNNIENLGKSNKTSDDFPKLKFKSSSNELDEVMFKKFKDSLNR